MDWAREVRGGSPFGLAIEDKQERRVVVRTRDIEASREGGIGNGVAKYGWALYK